jgi:hypothetical protein
MQLVLSSFLVVYLTRSAGLDLVLAGAPASLQAWRPPRLGLRRRSGGVTAPAAAWHSTADGRRCWIDEPVYHGMAGGRDRSRRHFAWRHRERLERRVPCGTRRPPGGSRPRDFGKPDVHLLGIVLGPRCSARWRAPSVFRKHISSWARPCCWAVFSERSSPEASRTMRKRDSPIYLVDFLSPGTRSEKAKIAFRQQDVRK